MPFPAVPARAGPLMDQAIKLDGAIEPPRAGRLRMLAAELAEIAAEIDGMPARPGLLVADGGAAGKALPAPEILPQPLLTSLARGLYAMRRRRVALFGKQRIFGEPAWDLLLDLYIAEQEGKRLPVTSACIGAAVPTTTGLRWLGILERSGLLVRENDPRDARRTYVRISPQAQAAMSRFLGQLAETLGEELERA